jgi:hypothetical protein
MRQILNFKQSEEFSENFRTYAYIRLTTNTFVKANISAFPTPSFLAVWW